MSDLNKAANAFNIMLEEVRDLSEDTSIFAPAIQYDQDGKYTCHFRDVIGGGAADIKQQYLDAIEILQRELHHFEQAQMAEEEERQPGFAERWD